MSSETDVVALRLECLRLSAAAGYPNVAEARKYYDFITWDDTADRACSLRRVVEAVESALSAGEKGRVHCNAAATAGAAEMNP